MTAMTSSAPRSGAYLSRPEPSGLADVVELILDKGLVIDAYVRVSLVGIEVLTIDLRIVIASVDTYLRFAEATNRLDLYQHGGKDLSELTESLSEGGARGKTSGALDSIKEKTSELLHGSSDDEDQDEDEYDDEYHDEDEEPAEDDEAGEDDEASDEPRRSSGRRSQGSRRQGSRRRERA